MRLLLALVLLLVGGCDDMIHQPKKNAYADQSVGPGPEPGGVVDYHSRPVAPPPVTLALLQRGQSRFRIYCTPCHSELGNGQGMIVQRGFPPPPSYHIARLRDAPVEHFYDVITNGHGVMYSFRLPRGAGGPLGHRRLHPRAAAQPERHGGRPHPRAEVGAAMRRGAALSGLAGLLLAALGWALEPAGFYGGWLAAVTLFAAWPLGSMALLMIHALTGGRWGDALQPALRLGVCALPLLLPAALPLIAGLAPALPLGAAAVRQCLLPERAVLRHAGSALPRHMVRAGVADPARAWAGAGGPSWGCSCLD